MRPLLATAAAASIVLVGALDPAAARAEIMDRIDEPAGDLVCAKWFGADQSKLEKLRGRVVIVHFSRPEVITSRAAVPSLRKLAETYADKAVTVVEVVVSDDEAKAAAYVEKEKPSWSVGFDANGTAAMKYPGTSVPRTYLVGPDGRVVWHQHVSTLPTKLVDEQLARLAFFAPSKDVKVGKAAAKFASEMRYREALDECAKIDLDKKATDADRELAKAIRADIPRMLTFLREKAEALYQAQDYGFSWRRFERMAAAFKGTEHEASIKKRMDELSKVKIVPYVVQAQNELDKLMFETPAKTPKQITELVAKLRQFAIRYSPNIPADRADAYADELEKSLAERAK